MIINDRVFEVKLLTRMTGAVHKNTTNFFKGVKVEQGSNSFLSTPVLLNVSCIQYCHILLRKDLYTIKFTDLKCPYFFFSSNKGIGHEAYKPMRRQKHFPHLQTHFQSVIPLHCPKETSSLISIAIDYFPLILSFI